MKIHFYTLNHNDGTSIMRALWPAMWINKFTEHSAIAFDSSFYAAEGHFTDCRQADVLVFHTETPAAVKLAKKVKALWPEKVIIYDTDDNDFAAYDAFYCGFKFAGIFDCIQEMLSLADGITVASIPLQEKYNAEYLPNAFDLTRPEYNPKPVPYYTDWDGTQRYKIAWGGGSNHTRDIAEFLQWNIIEEINEEFPCDWYFYGLMKNGKGGAMETKIPVGKGYLQHLPGKSVYQYIDDLYANADFLIAPLVDDAFNQYRSVLKMTEAGVASKTIVASYVATYTTYPGREHIRLASNRDEWLAAIRGLLRDREATASLGRCNRAIVEQNYDARLITDKRIHYYNYLREQQ